MIKYKKLKKNDKGDYLNERGKVLSTADAEKILQHQMPIEKVIEKLNYEPVQRSIILLDIPGTDASSGLYIGPNGLDKSTKDVTEFPMKVIAIATNSSFYKPNDGLPVIKVGDYVHIISGAACTINGLHVVEVRDHQVLGKFKV